MHCMGHCPKNAVETAHGFIIGVMILNSTLLLGLFYKYFEIFFYKIENAKVKFVVETLLFLSILAMCYRVIHYCMRFKIFERVMVYASLTKYKFWGRPYKALKYNE